MVRQTCSLALRCFGSVTIDYLPDILEPFGTYGKALGTMVKMVKDGIGRFKEEKEKLEKQGMQLPSLFEEVKRKAFEELKQFSDKLEIPKFMDCVVFTCKYGTALSEEQQELLRKVFLQEQEGLDKESLLVVTEFLKEYMGGAVEVDCVDDCQIGDTYINFNFFDEYGEQEHPYEKEDMDLVMETLNNILGVEMFDYYLVSGHDESWLND